MNTTKNKKLTLTRETLRTLTSDELRLVAGGLGGIRTGGVGPRPPSPPPGSGGC